MDGDYLKPLQTRVSLAKQIHTMSFRQSKVKKTESWFARSAKALDVELDDELYPDGSVFGCQFKGWTPGERRFTFLGSLFRVQRS